MNEANYSACKFSVDIVPYMYGELSVSGTTAFESHLVECSECTDEFAVISNARYEVYDWKKLAFDPIATPVFEIPYEAAEPAVSWVDKLRAAFGQSWAVPSVAFAGLIVASVIGAVFMFSGDDQLVVQNDNKNSGGTTAVNSPRRDVLPVVSNPSETKPDQVKSDPVPAQISSPRQIEAKRIKAVKASRTEEKPTSARNQKAPRLNEFTDEEDDSLRLAELFEDVETSD